MTCPICGHTNIPSLATSCPNCATNLVGIKLLDALENQYVATVKAKVALEGAQIQDRIEYQKALKKKNKWNNWLLFLLFLLPILYYFFGQPKQEIMPTSNVPTSDSLNIYKEKLMEKEVALVTANQELRAINNTLNIRTIEYVVKKGDMLFDLGLLFYNDSTAWRQIALDNKIYDTRGLPVGDTLKINYRE